MSVDNHRNNHHANHHLQVAPAAGQLASPLFLLDMGDLCLLISGRDIASLVAATQLSATVDAQSGGLVECELGRVPVFCLNKNLQPTAELPATHNALVILRGQGFYFALACIEMVKLTAEAPVIYPVPISMSSRKQPFTEFAIIGNRAAGFTDAATVAGLLRSRGAIIANANPENKAAVNG